MECWILSSAQNVGDPHMTLDEAIAALTRCRTSYLNALAGIGKEKARADAAETERLRFEGDLDKWMKIIGAGITGYQPEAYAVMDDACRELMQLRTKVAELEAAVDQREIDSGLTRNGNMWRFWSRKANETVVSNTKLRKEIAGLKALLRRWYQTGCPDCGGDCASANPPVNCCIVGETMEAIKEPKQAVFRVPAGEDAIDAAFAKAMKEQKP